MSDTVTTIVVPAASETTVLSVPANPAVVELTSIISGPQGPPGINAAASNTQTFVSAIDMGGHRIVATDASGMIMYADNIAAYKTVVGITTGATIAGDHVSVLISGELTDPSFNFDTSKPDLWLTVNGLITQSVPDIGAIVKIGSVCSQNAIFIKIEDYIERN